MGETPPAPGMTEATITELAGLYKVDRTTVWRALRGGRAGTRPAAKPATPGTPALPQPVNPGSSRPRYRIADFDPWWKTRPGVGRPTGP